MPAFPATSGTSNSDHPDQEILALHQAGQLISQYPRVRHLVADLPGPELLKAGQLLGRLAPDEILRQHPTVPAVTVAITGHGTLSALVPVLTAELARHGMLLRPHVADFDSYVFDLSDPGSALYAAGADLVLCVLDPMMVFDEVPVPWRPTDVERVLGEKLDLIGQLAAKFEATSQGTLVLNTIPLLHRHTAQLVDHQSRARLGAVWREANARLLGVADQQAGAVVIDLDPILAEGVPASDPRMSIYAKAYLSQDLLAGYAREVGHLARHLAGRTKKTLALDLDDTVWGGVLGEVGIEGIEVAESYRGEAFRAFQRVAKQIGSQGVLLAAVSKNDLEPVRKALTDQPSMTLHEEDFVQVIANWRPKHENLAELAEDLNVGIDSFVFADDSPYECGLVRRELPDVTVIQLDNEPALHVSKLLRDGWFDVRELTATDRTRASKYRDELVRKDFLHTFDSLDDYLRELDIRVRLAVAGDQDIPRVSQLTLRTNQFNLTTGRLQQADVRALADDPAWWVLAIHAADRFGENGLVGVVLARRDGGAVHLDNFVLSCRVFSRGIEHACLASVLRHARDTGADAVFGSYRPTAKNSAVKDFYPRYGFVPVADDDTTTTTFRHDLVDIMTSPEYVHLTESFQRSPS
ncbi:MAG: HAD-IIIC family phosphatase [Streptosporangiaceae bacterium]